MSDLIDSLRAALDAAEAGARKALVWPPDPGKWTAGYRDDGWAVTVSTAERTLIVADRLGTECAEHIAAWCPATVLRLVARDRQLIADYEEAEAYYSANLTAPAGELHGLGTALKAAAAFWLPKEDGSAPK